MKKLLNFFSNAKEDDDIEPPNFQQQQAFQPQQQQVFQPQQQVFQPQQQQTFQPQQYQSQIPNCIQCQSNFGTVSTHSLIRQITFSKQDEKLPVVSVIITACSGSSYDSLFTRVEQKVPDGRVSLYAVNYEGVSMLYEIMSGRGKKEHKELEIVQKLMKEIESVDPDCVLMNWECCSGCDDQGFRNKDTIKFVDLLLRKKHTVMFSDFAVKALIAKWDEKLLGKNPFVKVGECSHNIELHFKNKALESCDIPQLEAVGELCTDGLCNLHCLGGTVVVGVDWKSVDSEKKYVLEVLTVATKVDGKKPNAGKNLFENEDFAGTIGHAVVKFKEGGTMVVSAGHWIELSELDTTVEAVDKWSSKYGDMYQEDIAYLKSDKYSKQEKKKKMKMMSKMFIQQMPSCKQSKY